MRGEVIITPLGRQGQLNLVQAINFNMPRQGDEKNIEDVEKTWSVESQINSTWSLSPVTGGTGK